MSEMEGSHRELVKGEYSQGLDGEKGSVQVKRVRVLTLEDWGRR